MKVISVNNFKGGTTKTTISCNLSNMFAKSGYKVLMIDNDPQGNLSSKFVEEYEDVVGITEVYSREININQAIRKTEVNDNLFIITSKIKLADVAETMQNNAYVTILDKVIKEITDYNFDLIIIDNNPASSILLKNCIYAADLILIPTVIDRNATKGIDYTLDKFNQIIEYSPIDLDFDYRIVVSCVTYSKGKPTNAAREVLNALKERYDGKLLNSTIHHQNKPHQIQTFDNNYFVSEHESAFEEEYHNLMKEIERIINNIS